MAARDWIETHTGWTDEEVDGLFFHEIERIEARLMALPSSCAADMAAKMLVAHLHGESTCLDADHPAWVEARNLTGIGLDWWPFTQP